MSTKALKIAEDLLDRAENEDGYRAAASRAYYAVYQHVLLKAEQVGFKRTRKGEDHQLLIAFLKAQPKGSPLYLVGVRTLPRLRALRNHADYDEKPPYTRGLAEDAVDMASDVINFTLP